MRLLRLAVALPLALAMLAIPAGSVIACACVDTTPEMALEGSDAAFSGTVAGISQAAIGARPGAAPDTVFTFAGDGVARGDDGTEAEVWSHGDAGTCGVSF